MRDSVRVVFNCMGFLSLNGYNSSLKTKLSLLLRNSCSRLTIITIFTTLFTGPPMGQGQQYQESQQPAASYLHQATDKGNAELRPRERRLYQYIEPSRSGGGIRKMYGGTERKVKGTKAGEFPSYSSLPRRPGTIIYSLKVH